MEDNWSPDNPGETEILVFFFCFQSPPNHNLHAHQEENAFFWDASILLLSVNLCHDVNKIVTWPNTERMKWPMNGQSMHGEMKNGPNQKGKNSFSQFQPEKQWQQRQTNKTLNVLKNKSWKEHCTWPTFLYLILMVLEFLCKNPFS